MKRSWGLDSARAKVGVSFASLVLVVSAANNRGLLNTLQ